MIDIAIMFYIPLTFSWVFIPFSGGFENNDIKVWTIPISFGIVKNLLPFSILKVNVVTLFLLTTYSKTRVKFKRMRIHILYWFPSHFNGNGHHNISWENVHAPLVQAGFPYLVLEGLGDHITDRGMWNCIFNFKLRVIREA